MKRQACTTAVVTNMGVMRFHPETREMFLDFYYPGITTEKNLENIEYSVDVSKAGGTVPPSDMEMKVLREVCDPQCLIFDTAIQQRC